MQKHIAICVLPFGSSNRTISATSALTSFLNECQALDIRVSSFADDPKAGKDVIVCGGTSLEDVAGACKVLRETGSMPVVLIDTFCADESRRQQLVIFLNNHRIQFTTIPALIALLTLEGKFSYAYPKPDVSASVVVYFPNTTNILLITRKHEPWQGWLALPGGFLIAGQEDLAACASRELQEETGMRVKVTDLVHIDVRSNPVRDNRGHVIDQGFLYVVEDEQAVFAQLRAGDDADSLTLVPLSQALKTPLAADYNQLLQTVAKLLGRDNVVPFQRPGSSVSITGPRVARTMRRRSR